MSGSYEHCMECDSLTGRAGRAEDSLYHGYIGPFCEDCFEDWPDEQVAQITTLRQRLAKSEARVDELEAKSMQVGIDYSQAFILSKQAEAVEESAQEMLEEWPEFDVAHQWLIVRSESLAQQADELE